MIKFIAIGLICFYLLPERAHAQPIPNAVSCMARHAATGQFVPARHRTGFSQFWAHAAWDGDGWPSVTYGATYFQLPPVMQRFTSLHECGHLALQTLNEFEANCFALQQMSPSDATLNYIALFHQSIGPLGPQYGGSGAAFWAGTRQVC